MKGSLRQAGTRLRLAVQLVDMVSGAHLWAETYDRASNPDAVFELQDDLVPRIVSTVADMHGVLLRTMSGDLRSKDSSKLSPYEAVLRSFCYHERITAVEHAAARAGLEQAVQQAPGYANAWARLSVIYLDEHRLGFNGQPDPLGRALQAARRAADAAPSNAYARSALAGPLFHRKEFQAFRNAAEQAITLNPMDGASIGYLGMLTAYSGDWERGCAMAVRAMQINPRHPGWYWFPIFYNAYRKGDYREALSHALKINMPGFYHTHMVLAATYGQLGEREAASKALREALTLRPEFVEIVREDLDKWFDPELVGRLMEGLRKAGLDVPAGC